MDKSHYDFYASLSVISTNLQLYFSGRHHLYIPVSVELRKLLCDKHSGKDNSLLPRVFPDIKLHPLLGDKNKIDEYTTLYLPFSMKTDKKGVLKITEMVNEKEKSLPLKEWLDQNIFNQTTNLFEFIRSVADKEGAHSDINYNDVLIKTKSVFLANESLTSSTICAIGNYIVKIIAMHLLEMNIEVIWRYIQNQYFDKGRGLAIIELNQFTSTYSEEISLIYKIESEFSSIFGHKNVLGEEVKVIIREYQPLKEFIYAIHELNGGYWLYKRIAPE